MSQNSVQSNNQFIEIPHGWQLPKFQLGQPVSFRVRELAGQFEIEHGIISGITYRGVNTHPVRGIEHEWEYTIAIAASSPGWYVYGGMDIAGEDDIFVIANGDRHQDQVITSSSESYKLVLM